MKYFRISKLTSEKEEISYEKAYETISLNYYENVCTFDEMLSSPGIYPCRYCDIEVEEID